MLQALQRFLLEKSVSEINAVCPGGLINHYKTKRYGGFPKVGKRASSGASCSVAAPRTSIHHQRQFPDVPSRPVYLRNGHWVVHLRAMMRKTKSDSNGSVAHVPFCSSVRADRFQCAICAAIWKSIGCDYRSYTPTRAASARACFRASRATSRQDGFLPVARRSTESASSRK